MTNMSKEEKWMMLFDMQEHPEKYTDEQVERLLDDEEVKEFFHELAMARMAGKKANPKDVDVDGAWKEFVQAHHEDKLAMDAGRAKDAYRNRMKIAASIVGIIFLSGVALAAIHNGWLGFPASDQTADNKAATEQLATTQALANDSLRAATAEKKDDPQAAVISTSTSVAIASPSTTAAEEKNDPYAGRHSAATSTVIHRISTSAVCCT